MAHFKYFSKPRAGVFACQPGELEIQRQNPESVSGPQPRIFSGPNRGFIIVYFSNSGKNKNQITLLLHIKPEVLQETKPFKSEICCLNMK